MMTDKNADNHYEATIQVSDGKDNSILNVKVTSFHLDEDDKGVIFRQIMVLVVLKFG